MPASFEFTERQKEAKQVISGDAKHCMLFGGSRSGKTFILIWAVILRALSASMSRHAVLRFRFNHVKASVIHDTFPKVMSLCYPEREYKLDKTDWFAQFENGSQIWFGGLDDKERTEKILGQEYATMYLNEASQIPLSSRNTALTRLAQTCTYGEGQALRLKMYYDCNPPSKAHWSYKMFIQKQDAENKRPLPRPDNYVSLLMNPSDNLANLPKGYIQELEDMPARLRARFLLGRFADANANALWTEETLDKWRVLDGDIPDFQRIIVAVDPSGADDDENKNNDEIGICVAALGTDGNAYVLEDLTLKAGPATWGNVATTAFERHSADRVVGEDNYGGAMVKHVIQTARPGTPYEAVKASRGKVVRAEPISALFEQGKVRLVGRFDDLEDELIGFSTTGYTGERSPNRADAMIWAVTSLFPQLTKVERKWAPIEYDNRGIL